MINYDRLKIAHELIMKSDYGLINKLVKNLEGEMHTFYELLHPFKGCKIFMSLEDLIYMLEKKQGW